MMLISSYTMGNILSVLVNAFCPKVISGQNANFLLSDFLLDGSI